MDNLTQEQQERQAAAAVSLQQDGIPPDVQELLMIGNASMDVKPWALWRAINASEPNRLSPPAGDGVREAQEIVDHLFAMCDASNWDADGFRGAEFTIRQEIYEHLHEFASDCQDRLRSLLSPTGKEKGEVLRAEDSASGRTAEAGVRNGKV